MQLKSLVKQGVLRVSLSMSSTWRKLIERLKALLMRSKMLGSMFKRRSIQSNKSEKEFHVREFEGLTKVEISRRLVGRDVAVRKSDQSINFPILITSLLFMVGLPWLWISGMATALNKQSSYTLIEGVTVTPTPYAFINTPTPPAWMNTQPVVDVVVNYVTATPEIISTITPSAALSEKYTIGYSYYNPSLGGVNCHSANWDGSSCADTTASGIKWSDYIGKAVAVPPSWYCVGLGYGSIIRVLSPGSIAGDYTVIDLCSGCEANIWEDGLYRLDFLDTVQRLSWVYPVEVVVVAVVPPQVEYSGFCTQ